MGPKPEPDYDLVDSNSKRTRVVGKRIYACKFAGCRRSFTRVEHRRRHALTHHPDPMFPCTVPNCGKTFVRQDLLDRHRERHASGTIPQQFTRVSDGLSSIGSLMHPQQVSGLNQVPAAYWYSRQIASSSSVASFDSFFPVPDPNSVNTASNTFFSAYDLPYQHMSPAYLPTPSLSSGSSTISPPNPGPSPASAATSSGYSVAPPPTIPPSDISLDPMFWAHWAMPHTPLSMVPRDVNTDWTDSWIEPASSYRDPIQYEFLLGAPTEEETLVTLPKDPFTFDDDAFTIDPVPPPEEVGFSQSDPIVAGTKAMSKPEAESKAESPLESEMPTSSVTLVRHRSDDYDLVSHNQAPRQSSTTKPSGRALETNSCDGARLERAVSYSIHGRSWPTSARSTAPGRQYYCDSDECISNVWFSNRNDFDDHCLRRHPDRRVQRPSDSQSCISCQDSKVECIGGAERCWNCNKNNIPCVDSMVQNGDSVSPVPTTKFENHDPGYYSLDHERIEKMYNHEFLSHMAAFVADGLEQLSVDTVYTTNFDTAELEDCFGTFAQRLNAEGMRWALARILTRRSMLSALFTQALPRNIDSNPPVTKGSQVTIPSKVPISGSTDTSETASLADFEDDLHFKNLSWEDFSRKLDLCMKLIGQSRSYPWLLSRLRNITLLFCDNDESRPSVARSILDLTLDRSGHEYDNASEIVNVHLSIDWPLRRLLENQAELSVSSCTIGDLITLTGSPPDIQLSTCRDYTEQTWPINGKFLLEAVERALRSESQSCVVMEGPDDAYISVSFIDTTCEVSFKGYRHTLSEVAEQLGWLCAALREPPLEKLSLCSPYLRQLYCPKTSGKSQLLTWLKSPSVEHLDDSSDRMSGHWPWALEEDAGEGSRCYSLEILFAHTPADTDFPVGMCWQYLFPRCSIVQGFPILRRPQTHLGMELPLGLMAALIGTNRINEYRNTLYVRGFSAIYSPVQKLKDTIVWHLTCNHRGDHISYRDAVKTLLQLTHDDLENKRHVVGWCTKVAHEFDTTGGGLEVMASQLPVTRPGCVLDGFSLTFPKEIMYGPTFALLQSQKSLHLASAIYSAKLRYLKDHFALFWDTDHDRGWLTNCLHAFLYLIKNSLAAYKGETKLGLLKLWTMLRSAARDVASNGLHDATTCCGSWPTLASAQDESSNSVDDTVARVAEDIFARVCDQLFDGMDKLITYQEQVEHEDSRRSPRSLALLEGWNFHDLTAHHGSKRAHMTPLPTIAFAWAKLIRSLNTITIFGEGFGELLVPSSRSTRKSGSTDIPSRQSQHCQGLQTGRFIIAAALRDLKTKARRSKFYDSTLLLGDGTILPDYSSIFSECDCTNCACKKSELSKDFVRMPWPVVHRKLLPTLSPAPKDGRGNSAREFIDHHIDGAIVFGFDKKLGYYLDAKGNPVKGEPPDPAAEQEAFHDSGLGTESSPASSYSNTSRIRSTSIEEISTQKSAASSDQHRRQYGSSSVSGGANVFGDIYVTNNNTTAALQASYHDGRSDMVDYHKLSAPTLKGVEATTTDQGNRKRSRESLQLQADSDESEKSPSTNCESDQPGPSRQRTLRSSAGSSKRRKRR